MKNFNPKKSKCLEFRPPLEIAGVTSGVNGFRDSSSTLPNRENLEK